MTPDPAPDLDLSGLLPALRQHSTFRHLCAQAAAGDWPRHPLGILAAARSFV
ncbi:MAG: hypothetical protein HUU23_18500, partial [Caldilineales bacterium]|nr:hypothetical protein [Caldilineales bacterium]